MTAAIEHTAAVAADAREFPHVLDGVVLAGPAARLAVMLDRDFLDAAGWDPAMRVLSAPAQHRLLGRRVCRAESLVLISINFGPSGEIWKSKPMNTPAALVQLRAICGASCSTRC